MRIALFVPSLDGGGAERVTVNLACGLADRGFDVDLVLATRRGPFLAAVPTSVRIVDLGVSRVVLSCRPLARFLRATRPDVIISALDHANLVTLLAVRAAGTNTPVVAVVHTTMTRTIANPGAWTDRVVLPPLIRRFYRYAAAVVAVSDGAGDDLRRFLGDSVRVTVIPNPVLMPDLAARAEDNPTHPWFQDGGPPVFLGVGRLWHQKDFATLIRAFALSGLRNRARLVILGEGPLRRELELLRQELNLEEVVDLPGFSADPYPMMKRSVAFVLSSVFEALPTVLIEALALGTPVVATDCPTGPSEILDRGRWGRLVAVGDVDGLSAAMSSLLAERSSRLTIPVGVLAAYTLDAAVERYAALVGSVRHSAPVVDELPGHVLE
jgi:glycosyltransferase involved in cell wall biosynthesis